MNRAIFQLAIVVKNYDEAIEFYTRKLGFELIEDTVLSPEKRWVVVAPSANSACKLLLAKASGDEQLSRVGNQTGGRVFLFMHTDNLERDYQNLKNNQVHIVREPIVEAWGKVLVFADIYGNLWDLIEPSKPSER
jgi:catechol 2,3-dioxygenase-like lactoylglutathione lyase family enzyme